MDASFTYSSPLQSESSSLESDNMNDKEVSAIEDLDRYLWIYCSPFILAFGLTGNILIICVIHYRNLQRSSTTVYLPALAVMDSFTLITGIIPEWLDAMLIVTIKEISAVSCKLEKFLFYTSADTATWILVLFTLDRFIAVCFPLKKRSVCSPNRARIAVIIVLITSMGKNTHVFWTRGPEYDQHGNLTRTCGRPPPYDYFEQYIRPWIAFVYANAIPFLILLTCNIMIIRTLMRVQKMRRDQTTAEKSLMQTVFMCLSASFTFLVCITPSIALLIGRPYWTSDDERNYGYDIAKAINNQFAMVNHSINVLLYCASGKKFRQDVVAMLRCNCCQKEEPDHLTSSIGNNHIDHTNNHKNGLRLNASRTPNTLNTRLPQMTKSEENLSTFHHPNGSINKHRHSLTEVDINFKTPDSGSTRSGAEKICSVADNGIVVHSLDNDTQEIKTINKTGPDAEIQATQNEVKHSDYLSNKFDAELSNLSTLSIYGSSVDEGHFNQDKQLYSVGNSVATSEQSGIFITFPSSSENSVLVKSSQDIQVCLQKDKNESNHEKYDPDGRNMELEGKCDKKSTDKYLGAIIDDNKIINCSEQLEKDITSTDNNDNCSDDDDNVIKKFDLFITEIQNDIPDPEGYQLEMIEQDEISINEIDPPVQYRDEMDKQISDSQNMSEYSDPELTSYRANVNPELSIDNHCVDNDADSKGCYINNQNENIDVAISNNECHILKQSESDNENSYCNDQSESDNSDSEMNGCYIVNQSESDAENSCQMFNELDKDNSHNDNPESYVNNNNNADKLNKTTVDQDSDDETDTTRSLRISPVLHIVPIDDSDF